MEEGITTQKVLPPQVCTIKSEGGRHIGDKEV